MAFIVRTRMGLGLVVLLVSIAWSSPEARATPVYQPLIVGTAMTPIVHRDIPFLINHNHLAEVHTHPWGTRRQVNDVAAFDPFHANTLHVISTMGYATDVLQGEKVGDIFAYYSDGTFASEPLLGGVQLSEWAWDRPGQPQSHSRAEVAYSWRTNADSYTSYLGHAYYSSFTTDPTKAITGIRLRMTDRSYSGSLGISLYSITSEISAGGAVPEIDPSGLAPAAALLAGALMLITPYGASRRHRQSLAAVVHGAMTSGRGE